MTTTVSAPLPRAILAVALALIACSGGGEGGGGTTPQPDGGAASGEHPATDAGAEAAPVVDCTVSAPTSCPEPAPKYADIAPIVKERCVVACHNGTPGGPWPFTDYEHISDWRDEVRADLVGCLMPPPNAPAPMPMDERLLILTWLRCGLPQ